jgi:hypothetical protein
MVAQNLRPDLGGSMPHSDPIYRINERVGIVDGTFVETRGAQGTIYDWRFEEELYEDDDGNLVGTWMYYIEFDEPIRGLSGEYTSVSCFTEEELYPLSNEPVLSGFARFVRSTDADT